MPRCGFAFDAVINGNASRLRPGDYDFFAAHSAVKVHTGDPNMEKGAAEADAPIGVAKTTAALRAMVNDSHTVLPGGPGYQFGDQPCQRLCWGSH
jgi:hypothetical protein